MAIFNLTPEQFGHTGFLEVVRGVVLSSRELTCQVGSSAREFDFFVASPVLVDMFLLGSSSLRQSVLTFLSCLVGFSLVFLCGCLPCSSRYLRVGVCLVLFLGFRITGGAANIFCVLRQGDLLPFGVLSRVVWTRSFRRFLF